MKLGQKKLRIHVTPTLSTNADSSTDIRKSPLFDTFIHFYGPFSPFLLLQFLNNFFFIKKKLSRVIYHDHDLHLIATASNSQQQDSKTEYKLLSSDTNFNNSEILEV